MPFAAVPYGPSAGPDHDVHIDTFCEKLKARVAVRNRYGKMPEPKTNWVLLAAVGFSGTVWFLVLNALLVVL